MKKMFYVILFACALLTTVSSCKKDKKTSPVSPPAGSLQLWSNVHIIDSTQWILFVNSVHPANGVYMYTFTPSTPNINVQIGDILVGTANGGYIRKVTSTSLQGAYYVIQTTQATLADVFKTGSFNFAITINDSLQGNSGVSRQFSNIPIFRSSSFEASLLFGQFYIQPTCNFSFSFDSAAGLTNFQLSTANAVVKDSVYIGFAGNMPPTWVHDTILGTFTTNSVQLVQAWTPSGNVEVPVVVKLNTNFTANGNGLAVVEPIDTRVAWSGSNIFTGGAQYQSGQWQVTNNSIASNFVAIDTFSLLTSGKASISFLSQINSYLYSVAGPQISIGLAGDLYQTQANSSSSSPFDRRTDAWTSSSESFTPNAEFGNSIGSLSHISNTDSVFFQTPYQVVKISGDNQTDSVVYTLPQPLVVKVTDSNGQPVSGVTVTFTVTQGGGTLSAYTLLSDQNGLAQVTWKLGIPMGTQSVTVKVVNGYNQPLLGTPAVFIATGV